jgi:hypothetical protein
MLGALLMGSICGLFNGFLVSRIGITPILFVQPWNRCPHPFREVSTWEEIGALMAE